MNGSGAAHNKELPRFHTRTNRDDGWISGCLTEPVAKRNAALTVDRTRDLEIFSLTLSQLSYQSNDTSNEADPPPRNKATSTWCLPRREPFLISTLPNVTLLWWYSVVVSISGCDPLDPGWNPGTAITNFYRLGTWEALFLRAFACSLALIWVTSVFSCVP